MLLCSRDNNINNNISDNIIIIVIDRIIRKKSFVSADTSAPAKSKTYSSVFLLLYIFQSVLCSLKFVCPIFYRGDY